MPSIFPSAFSLSVRTVLFAIVLGLPMAAHSQAVKIGGELKVWHKVELTFDGPATSETANPNPYTDYRVDVTFTGPAGQSYLVPGYYAADGNAGESGATSGNKWRVNFPPDAIGEWKFKAAFVSGKNIAAELTGGTPAGFFHDAQGTFIVGASDKTGKDLRAKGKLEYVGEHYLQFRGSKEYFFKAGANSPEVFLEYKEFDNTPSDRLYSSHVKDWSAGDPTWKNGQGKGIIGVVNYLSSIGINAIYFLTMNTHGDGKKAWPWLAAEDRFRYDVSKLDQWEIVFEHFDRKGMMLHFVTTETENEAFFEIKDDGKAGGFGISRKIYYRELVARFGHHMAISWNLGEENGWSKPAPYDLGNTDQQRKDFSDRMQALAYYRDHITIHNGPSSDDNIFQALIGHPSFTGPAQQWHYNRDIHERVLHWRNASNASGHKWVCTMDEPYIGSLTGDKTVWRKNIVWGTFMAGGAGSELYIGARGDLTVEDYRPFLDYHKAGSIGAHFFSTYVPRSVIPKLDPDDKFVSGGWSLKSNGEAYILYLQNGGSPQIALPAGNYSVGWYNPREGGEMQAGSKTKVAGGGTVSLGTPPGEATQDWTVLVLNENTTHLQAGIPAVRNPALAKMTPFVYTGQDLVINVTEGRDAHVELYNSRGEIVRNFKAAGTGRQALSLRGMKRGIYFVRTTGKL